MNLKIIMILSSIFSSSSSVASLFPALSFESTCFAVTKSKELSANHSHNITMGIKKENIRVTTYELCRLIWPFVNERLKSLLHGVDELVVFHEADVDDVIHLVFKIQQLLHHCFVLFWIDYNCASKSLQRKGNNHKQEWQEKLNRKKTSSRTKLIGGGPSC